MTRTISIRRIEVDELSASSLREAAETQPDSRAYRAAVYDEDDNQAAESIQAVMLRTERRVGIAWGADAEWGDLETLTDDEVATAIEEYLNDEDAWAGRN